MASPRSLLEWCCVTCASYPGVDIKDMSSSFRDGLAFCAIIHKHRPDLIDFSSLSKEDVYQNNKLAFQVAETKLGVPALLDPKDLVSAKVPDCLSVITYISQLYYFFNRKPCVFPSRGSSSHILKSGTDLETSRGRVPQTSGTACASCSQPVHLIQRRLSGGKVYHRSCFRCKICHSSLLFDSYRSDTSSLVCAHHDKDAQTSPAELNQQTQSTANRDKCGVQTGFSGLYSLDGSAITSVPRYTQTQQEAARKTPQAGKDNRKEQEDKETERRGPVPASRIRTAQTTSSSPAAETTEHPSKSPPGSSQISSRPKVKPSHPWMTLVHPGPWTQLPLAPPPVPPSRVKSASNLQGSWIRPKVPAPPNPFEEEEVQDSDGAGPEPGSSGAAVQSENSEETGVDGSGDPEDPVTCSEQDEENPSGRLPEGGPTQIGGLEAALCSTSAGKQNLPRSLSVPAIPCSHRPTNSESAFKEGPGQTFRDLSSPRGPAPGHGFPLIRRKVRSEQSVCLDDLQEQRRHLDKLLEDLERRGVELERNIRDGRSGKDWDQRLTEWTSLFHERHVTLRRDKELVCLMKQQRLEDRQGDVEYELRCLLNKPERDWTQKDQEQEQQLLDELVTIIDQRNQIISSLDQDIQRGNDEDVFCKNRMSNKDVQKDGLTELKKHKGIQKILKSKKWNHKPENNKNLPSSS